MFSLPRWLGGRGAPNRAAELKSRATQLCLEQLEERRVPATMSAASSSAMFLIRPDRSIWEYSSNFGWIQLTSPGFGVAVSAVHETATGNDVVYALATNGWVYQYHLGAPWVAEGAFFKAISAGLDASGYAEVFALTANNGLYEFNRTVGVELLGTNVATMTTAGRETVYAVLTTGSVSVHTTTGWSTFGSAISATQIAAAAPSSGSPTVYVMNGQGFAYESTGGNWSQVIGEAGAISAGTDANGNAALFVIGGINGGLSLPALYEFSSQSSGQTLGYYQESISATDSDVVFATLSDRSVWYHSAANGWVNLAPAGTAFD